MGMMLVRRRLQTASNAAKRSVKSEEPADKTDESETRPAKKTVKKKKD